MDTQQIYPKWEDNADRLILYADTMGFKNRVLSTENNELQEQLLDFTQAWRKKMSPFIKHLKYVQFSDSFLIVANGNDAKMFNIITRAAECLMYIATEKHFPIKGVIAEGDFIYNEKLQLYFGKPLVEAYELYNEIKYYGIVVHHSAEKTIKQYTTADKPYSNTLIPLEKGKTAHYHLCWNMVDDKYQYSDNTQKFNNWLDIIAEKVSGKARIYIDLTKEVFDNDVKYCERYYMRKTEKQQLSRKENIQALIQQQIDNGLRVGMMFSIAKQSTANAQPSLIEYSRSEYQKWNDFNADLYTTQFVDLDSEYLSRYKALSPSSNEDKTSSEFSDKYIEAIKKQMFELDSLKNRVPLLTVKVD